MNHDIEQREANGFPISYCLTHGCDRKDCPDDESDKVYDDTNWDVEPADPSTGIWTHTWAHTTCPKEYERGCEETSTLAGREVKNGLVYADETFTIDCLDCGASTRFTDKTFMGFDGEQGV